MIHDKLEKMCSEHRHKFSNDDEGIAAYVEYRSKLTILTYAIDDGELTVGEAMMEARV